MGFKVGQSYRINELSFVPGGVTVIVQETSGRRFEYDKIKYPQKYIAAAKRRSNVIDAWIKVLKYID
jgi:hypothetical protein